MAGVALVFFVVLFFSLSSNSSQNYLVCAPSFLLCPKNVKIVNTQKSSSQNFSSNNAHELSKGHKKQRSSFFHYDEKPIIYNQSSSLVCAPFLHRLYLFIGCERERERERGRDRLAIEHVRADRIENRIDIDRLFIIDRFSSRARGVVPREKAAVRVDVGLSRLSYRSIARAFFLSSIGRK